MRHNGNTLPINEQSRDIFQWVESYIVTKIFVQIFLHRNFCFVLLLTNKNNVLSILQGIGWKCRWGQSALCKMLLIKIVFVGEFHQVRFSEELVSVPFVTSSRSSDFLRRHQHPGKWSSWPIWWHKWLVTRKKIINFSLTLFPGGLHLSNNRERCP